MGEAQTQAATEVITLEQWLAAWIDRLSDPAERAREAAQFGDRLVFRMGGLGREPPKSPDAWAEVVLLTDGPPRVVASFGYGPRKRGNLDRITELPFSVLLCMGELLEDSKKHLRRGGA